MADEGYPLPGVTSITTISEWEHYFRAWNVSGVIRGIGNELVGSLNSGARTAVVGTGRAMLRGFHKPVTTATPTAIPAASAQNRVDRLALRLDRAAGTAADFIKPVVVPGTSGSTNPPALQASDTGQWDLPICRWTSQADGGLSGLVDERYWSDQSFWSWARPPATPHRFGIELDGGIKLMWSDGTAWQPIGASDTGWVSFSVTGNWAPHASNPLMVRKINNVVTVRGGLNRTGNTLPASDSNSPVAVIPAGFRPPADWIYNGWVYPSGAQLRISASNGALTLLSHPSDIGVGGALYISTTYMIA